MSAQHSGITVQLRKTSDFLKHCGPFMNNQKRLSELFRFHEDIYRKVRKSRVRVFVHYKDMTCFLYVMGVFIFFKFCYWVCKHTQVPFLPDCSFKICEIFVDICGDFCGYLRRYLWMSVSFGDNIFVDECIIWRQHICG